MSSTVSLCAAPPFAAICVAPWICATAENVTGEPVNPEAVAVAVWVPALGPSVRPIVATPVASVELLAAVTDPPPVATAHETETPAWGAPCASLTSTASGAASGWPAAPTWLLPLLMLIVPGGLLG